MKHPFAHAHGLAALIFGVFAVTAHAAGQNKPPADPADANASVPATRYESFLTTSPLPSAASPADNWKALNRVVASSTPMSHTMDPDEPKPREPAVSTASSAAANETKPSPGAPHAGHGAQAQDPPDPHAQHRPGVAK